MPKLLHSNKLWHGIAPHLGVGRCFKWNIYALIPPIEVLMDCVFNTYGFHWISKDEHRSNPYTIWQSISGNPRETSQQHTQQTPVIERMKVCMWPYVTFNDPTPMMFGSWTLGFPETKGHQKLKRSWLRKRTPWLRACRFFNYLQSKHHPASANDKHCVLEWLACCCYP